MNPSDSPGSCVDGLGRPRIGALELVVEMRLICVLNCVCVVSFVSRVFLVEFPLSVLVNSEAGVRAVAPGGFA